MAKITGNQQLVKQINKSLVLETIYNEAPISRADIAQRVGLNKGTVSSLVNELIEGQLIYESGPGKSNGGRRPVMLLFNEKAGYSIGIDLGVNYILGILTDLKGNIVSEVQKKLCVHSVDQVKPILFEIIEELSRPIRGCHYGIIGIGFGIPGIVSHDGEILLAPNLGWKNIRIKEEIEDRFQVPVIIENEANAGAYGEKLYGAGKEFDNILYVSAGIGIGVGVILHGKLFTGSGGFSGEMGHTIIQVNGKECTCGSKGCWEQYASEKALLEEAKKIGLPIPDKEFLSIEYLVELAEAGNKEVIHLFGKIGTYLGVGLTNIINTFNPDQIIIGNRLALAKKWLEEPMKQFVKSHALTFHQQHLAINFSKLSTHSTAIGMCALSIDHFLKTAIK
jgi:ROK family./MarR family.